MIAAQLRRAAGPAPRVESVRIENAKAAVTSTEAGYKVLEKIRVGGASQWDYVYLDSVARRLYVAHANQTEVIDLATDKIVGAIADTAGVHGIAVANDLGRGFTSNGRTNNVSVFDLRTLQTLATVNTGTNPDAIVYEPVTHRVVTFNGRSNDATVIDARTGSVLGSVAVGGKPEFAQADGKGRVYFNIEDTNELAEMDTSAIRITKRFPLSGCDRPSGLAMDRQRRHLFSVCGNNVMTISDPDAGKVIATAPIGAGADGVAFDDGYAFSANGRDGTVTVVGDRFEVVQTVPTQASARTIGVDPTTHKLYLPAAEPGPATVSKDGKQGRPSLLPDSFTIIVVGK
jgi:DNA-binding beta-propeller fold protein YncE